MTQDLKTEFDLKKFISKTLSVIFCMLSAICVLVSVLLLVVFFSKSPENTLQIFSYKIYGVQNDIPDTDITAGALIVVKNTDSDDFYTPQTLKENTVLKIDGLGDVLQNDAMWATLCFTSPLMLLFFLVTASELKKLFVSNAEKKQDNQTPVSIDEEY